VPPCQGGRRGFKSLLPLSRSPGEPGLSSFLGSRSLVEGGEASPPHSPLGRGQDASRIDCAATASTSCAAFLPSPSPPCDPLAGEGRRGGVRGVLAERDARQCHHLPQPAPDLVPADTAVVLAPPSKATIADHAILVGADLQGATEQRPQGEAASAARDPQVILDRHCACTVPPFRVAPLWGVVDSRRILGAARYARRFGNGSRMTLPSTPCPRAD
jgi:hypothetical protein